MGRITVVRRGEKWGKGEEMGEEEWKKNYRTHIVELFQVTFVRGFETHYMVLLWFHSVEYGGSSTYIL